MEKLEEFFENRISFNVKKNYSMDKIYLLVLIVCMMNLNILVQYTTHRV